MLRDPVLTGALMPSSQKLSKKMLEPLKLDRASLVVELGPGTGAFTRMIRERIPHEAQLLCIEASPVMVSYLKDEIPGIHVVHGYAENLGHYLKAFGGRADYIVSGLPLAIFPKKNIERVLEAIHQSLHEKGSFVTFQYLHAAIQKRGRLVLEILRKKFKDVSLKRVYGNIPPAKVIICTGPN